MIPVVLESPSMTRDATFNEEVATWVVEAETHATKRTLSTREAFVAAMHNAAATTEFEFRWRSKLDPRWRIREVRTGELHEIVGMPYDPDGKRRRLVVPARTFKPDTATELTH